MFSKITNNFFLFLLPALILAGVFFIGTEGIFNWTTTILWGLAFIVFVGSEIHDERERQAYARAYYAKLAEQESDEWQRLIAAVQPGPRHRPSSKEMQEWFNEARREGRI